MIRHLLRLVWNRKRSTALIILEIFVSFLVLFAVATMGFYFHENWRRPLGYSYENVWNVGLDVKQTTDDVWSPEMSQKFATLLRELRGMPEIESVAGIFSPPYSNSTSLMSREMANKRIEDIEVNQATDGLLAVLKLDLVRGRWFEPADDALDWKPVVIDQELSKAVFGDNDPIGKLLSGSGDTVPWKVVGVVSDFRRSGELSGPGLYMFERQRVGDVSDRPPRNFVVRLRPGTSARFEEQLVRRLGAVVRDWSFEVETLVAKRESALRLRLAPLLVMGTVAGFLLLMVGLGLMGVVWQNVTRRTKEIGLRRAMGATGGSVCGQVLGELLLITTIGLALGTVLVVQLPLLDLVAFIGPGAYIRGLATAIGAMYVLTLLSGLYPSRLAARVQPAEALHYE